MPYAASPYPASYLNGVMAAYSQWLGAPSGLLQSVAQQESSYDPATGAFHDGCNWAGACGLMQLKPIALADVQRVIGTRLDANDPVQSIVAAAVLFLLNWRYMAPYLGGEAPGWGPLIVAYNGGWVAGVYAFYGAPIPAESANYLAQVGGRIGVA